MPASNPPIHGNRAFVPASTLLQAIADSLSAIKHEDRLTYADMGYALGKSEDQAAKYADGSATMDALTFLRACSAFNGRFANPVLAMIGQHVAPNDGSAKLFDHTGMIALTRLLLNLQEATADGRIDDAELRSLAPFIEAAGAHIDGLRARLGKSKTKGE